MWRFETALHIYAAGILNPHDNSKDASVDSERSATHCICPTSSHLMLKQNAGW
jgi:hypothetical protein